DRAAHEASDDPVLEVEIESHRGRLLQVVKHRGEEGRAATFLAADKARILWGNPPVEITPRERNAYVAALQAAFDSSMVEEDGASLLRLAEEMAQVAGGSEEGPIWAAHNRSDALMFAGRVGEGLESARRAWTQARERVLPMPTLSAGPTLVSKLRSEEHTSELQSPYDLVCRLLLEKKKTTKQPPRSAAERGVQQEHAICAGEGHAHPHGAIHSVPRELVATTRIPPSWKCPFATYAR